MTKTIDIADVQIMDIVNILTVDNTMLCGYVMSKTNYLDGEEEKYSISVYICENNGFSITQDQISRIEVVVPYKDVEEELTEICVRHYLKVTNKDGSYRKIDELLDDIALAWKSMDEREREVISYQYLKDNIDELISMISDKNSKITELKSQIEEMSDLYKKYSGECDKYIDAFNELHAIIKAADYTYQKSGQNKFVATALMPGTFDKIRKVFINFSQK